MRFRVSVLSIVLLALASGRLMLTHGVTAHEAKAPSSHCAIGSVNLTTIAGRELVGSTYTGQQFHATVCGVSSQTACVAMSPTASTCQVAADGSSVVYGEWTKESKLVETESPFAALQQLSSSTVCSERPSVSLTSSIRFYCSPYSGVMVAQSDPCAVDFYYNTPLACNPPLRPAGSCSWSPDGKSLFDFTSLKSGNDLTTVDSEGNLYLLHLCDAIESVTACSDLNVYTGACILRQGTPHNVGSWVDWQWSYILPSAPQLGVQLTLTGDDRCGDTRSTSVIRLVCDAVAGSMTVSFDEATCTYSWTIPTLLSCPEAQMFHKLAQAITD